MDVSRYFQENFLSVLLKIKVRVFQGCSVLESSLLHATHRSYPSRRRACLIMMASLNEKFSKVKCFKLKRFLKYEKISHCFESFQTLMVKFEPFSIKTF